MSVLVFGLGILCSVIWSGYIIWGIYAVRVSTISLVSWTCAIATVFIWMSVLPSLCDYLDLCLLLPQLVKFCHSSFSTIRDFFQDCNPVGSELGHMATSGSLVEHKVRGPFGKN